MRKAFLLRLLPDAHVAIRRAAKRERLTIADFVERWALSLPPE